MERAAVVTTVKVAGENRTAAWALPRNSPDESPVGRSCQDPDQDWSLVGRFRCDCPVATIRRAELAKDDVQEWANAEPGAIPPGPMSETTKTSGFFDTIHVAVIGDDPELESALEAALGAGSTRWRVSPLAFRPESIPIVDRLSAQIVIVCGAGQEAEARVLLSELSATLPGIVRILLASEMDREAAAHLVLVEPYDVEELRDIIEVAHGTWRSLADTG